mgnify:CR=1 FL=1
MKLSKKSLLVVSVMLFALFFGAGNLIFPPFLGQNAGEKTLPAMIGFLVTAVVLPVLGVVVVARFDGLEKLIQKRTDNASMGFGSQLRTTPDKDETRQKLLKNVEPDDLVKFGLIPELIGRLPVVTVLDPLDEEALVRVLTEPKNSIVRQYKELLHLDNAELVFTDAALHAIAKKTVERKSGARGLRSVVEELLIPIMYDIPSDATITKVTIDADTVEGGQPHIEHGAMRPRYKSLTEQQ